jgi:trimeric autotransporter adhesin
MYRHVGQKAVRLAASVIVLGLLGSLAGCGNDRRGSGDTATEPPTATVTLRSVEVTPTNAEAAAGTTVQFTATGIYTDNSTRDLTGQVTWASSASTVAAVSNTAGSNGLVTTVGVGSTTVSATSGNVTGTTAFTVTAATLVSIEVTPPAASVASGLTRQFTATGVFSDNSTQDLTSQVTWASSNVTVATVSDALGSMGLATAVGVGATTIAATSGGVSGSTPLTVTPARLVSIEVSPVSAAITNGSTRQFTATGVFSDNSTQDLTSQVSWASSNATVATVSDAAGSNGLATAFSVGTATIGATLEGVTGSATLTVTPAALVSIEITPAAASLANGATQRFSATGVYADNSTQDLTTEVTWASSDTAVASVSNAAGSKGLATTAGVGSATVSATSGDVTGSTALTVTPAALVSIEVTPAAASVANGLTQQFTATGVFSDNSTQDLTSQVTWASSDDAIATVSNAAGSNGLASTAGVGTTTVSANSGDVTGDTTLTVTAATLLSIEVSPTTASVANGLTQQFTATGLYTDNTTQDLTTQVTWASSDNAVATVSNAAGSNGLATTAGLGSATVSATSGSVTGDAALTVTAATLVTIDVSPATASVANGLTQQFTATGAFSDTTTQDLTAQVTWASSNNSVATVSNAAGSNGLATTAGVGNTTVSATRGAVTGDAALTVTDATLVSIEVSPAAASIANGLTQQLTATGRFSDNTTQDLTTLVTWASSDSAVASVSNAAVSSGLATATAVGNTTVSATSGAVTGSTTLTVTPAVLVSIEVAPAAPSIASGLTQQFTATGYHSDNSTQDLTTTVTWASSDGSVATISNAAGSIGLATATGVGSTLVSATSGAVSGSTTLTVTQAVPSVDQQILALLEAVTDAGAGSSLVDKLTAARTYLAVPDIASACTMMNDFNNQVLAQRGKKYPEELADQWMDDANAIKAAIPCP